jgi:hypothetical protein
VRPPATVAVDVAVDDPVAVAGVEGSGTVTLTA